MNQLIYLDNAATTQVYQEVLDAMIPYFTEYYGNPSSIYTFAGKAKRAVDVARAALAEGIGAAPEEIYFTGGGSESDNWALKAAAEAYAEKGKHIITSKIEHHAILHTAEYLEKKGYRVTYLDVDENGLVNIDELKAAIRPDTILISIMAANNEIGTIEPLEKIGAVAKENGILFHTDAVQAFGHIPINVDKLHIDMLSASAHKLGGPKGIGMLYIRKGIKLRSFIHGGAQERQRRAGTHNVPGIAGFGKAAELALRDMEKHSRYESELRDYLIERILTEIPYSRLNGDRTNRLSNNANFCFRFIEGESLLILLDQNGICASSGSACTSGSLDPSHVLLAIGLPHEIAHGSLRLTISEKTTKEEIDFTVDKIKEIVERLRNMSPLYEDFIKKQQKSKSAFDNNIWVSKRRERKMYSEKVMDHFNNPRNVGEMENPSGVGTVGNAKCGDIMRIYLDIDEEGVIREAKFKTFGCGAAVATSSMATELVKGKTVQEALQVTNRAVMEALDGLPPVKVHCSLLAEEAIHAALWDYAEKNNIKIEGLEKPVNDIEEKEEAMAEEY